MLFKKQTALDEIFFQYLPPFLCQKEKVEPKERGLVLLLACAKSISSFSLPKRKGGAKREEFSRREISAKTIAAASGKGAAAMLF